MDVQDDEQQLLLAPLLAAAQNGIGSDNGEGSKAMGEVHRLFATGEARDAADWDQVACYQGVAGILTESWQTSARARTPAEREAASSLDQGVAPRQYVCYMCEMVIEDERRRREIMLQACSFFGPGGRKISLLSQQGTEKSTHQQDLRCESRLLPRL